MILVKLEGQSKATFAALFGLRAGGGVDLSAAYRYNQNMMEYYTCEYKLYQDEQQYKLYRYYYTIDLEYHLSPDSRNWL